MPLRLGLRASGRPVRRHGQARDYTDVTPIHGISGAETTETDTEAEITRLA